MMILLQPSGLSEKKFTDSYTYKKKNRTQVLNIKISADLRIIDYI